MAELKTQTQTQAPEEIDFEAALPSQQDGDDLKAPMRTLRSGKPIPTSYPIKEKPAKQARLPKGKKAKPSTSIQKPKGAKRQPQGQPKTPNSPYIDNNILIDNNVIGLCTSLSYILYVVLHSANDRIARNRLNGNGLLNQAIEEFSS